MNYKQNLIIYSQYSQNDGLASLNVDNATMPKSQAISMGIKWVRWNKIK
jgi:hypothetical protein